ncbi:hypothetical protein JOC77_002246 [Peribacillus deserti]|uniref:Uracil-DNA glycosylase-like domain-containing protein n=1 Tax=Peribacillus deserti TaxID=673318 RepID=A0ABS2QIM4_9BACI|nr:hypothetical protein [Peribacillus deserti]MBM7692815.1 hypothetical protein [Peribacillus deserti]
MSVHSETLRPYIHLIESLPAQELEKKDLLIPELIMEKSGGLEMYYAPHNEYINVQTRIVIAGITPGWNQMKMAFEQAKRSIQQGASLEQIACDVKKAARFAGTMRNHLIKMLDSCGLPEALGLQTSRQLFGDRSNLLHTTSVIKYPVFSDGKNYTGHAPKIDHSSLLKKYAYEIFPQEIIQLEKPYLLIPLGKSVSEVIRTLMDQGRIPRNPCLLDFPHPSGANGHRHKQFEKLKSHFKTIVEDFALTHLTKE